MIARQTADDVRRFWARIKRPRFSVDQANREASSRAVVDGAAPLTVCLAEIDRGAVALVGGKGANLGGLAKAGFPVPNGFVLTTPAYALAAEAAGADPARPAEAAERLRAAPMPEAIANAARKAYAALDGRVAVRASATAEDPPGASVAGQQGSYLDGF